MLPKCLILNNGFCLIFQFWHIKDTISFSYVLERILKKVLYLLPFLLCTCVSFYLVAFKYFSVSDFQPFVYSMPECDCVSSFYFVSWKSLNFLYM